MLAVPLVVRVLAARATEIARRPWPDAARTPWALPFVGIARICMRLCCGLQVQEYTANPRTDSALGKVGH